MEGFEIQNCLESMSVIVDTREQPGERASKRYNSFGCPYSRSTLSYGDYTYNFVLPSGDRLFDETKTICGDVIVERKMSLEELSGCLCQTRDRFAAEFKRAKENKATIYLIVEDASWEKLITGKYNTKFNPVAYFASLTAFIARYNIKPIFCKKETSGKIIKEVLYRELKERLESGFYG